MKGLDSVIRLQRWQLDEKRRKLTDLERLRAELLGRLQRLDHEVQQEGQLAGRDNEVAAAFPKYVSAALQQKQTLRNSIGDVDTQIVAAQDDVSVAFEAVKRYETVADNHVRRQRAEIARRLRAELDEVGIESHRRRRELG